MADLIQTEGFAKKWLGQFADSLETSKKLREKAIEKARVTGLKDKAQRLIKLHRFWMQHPELESLAIARSQNPEQFDEENPEHANIKDVLANVNTIFMEGNDADIVDYTTRLATPATLRANKIFEIKTDKEKFSDEMRKNIMQYVGDGSPKALHSIAMNPKGAFANVDNASAIYSEASKLRNKIKGSLAKSGLYYNKDDPNTAGRTVGKNRRHIFDAERTGKYNQGRRKEYGSINCAAF
jgi:hypothetical protein